MRMIGAGQMLSSRARKNASAAVPMNYISNAAINLVKILSMKPRKSHFRLATLRRISVHLDSQTSATLRYQLTKRRATSTTDA